MPLHMPTMPLQCLQSLYYAATMPTMILLRLLCFYYACYDYIMRTIPVRMPTMPVSSIP